nr:hypothetical protein [Armatimonadota bacterium]
SPAMPATNARDYFIQASALAKETVVVNGKTKDESDAPLTTSELGLLSQSNQPAFKMLHEGFAFPYQEPPARSFSALFPYYAKERHLARALAFDARYKTARGDWAGATNSSLDSVQLGEMVPRGGVLIGMLVGVACQAIGRRQAWKAVPHLTGPQAQSAARRLEQIRARHVPFADTLQEEKWFTQAAMQETFRHPGWRGSLGDLSGGTAGKFQQAQLWFTSKRAILTNYTRYMDQAIANARQPYGAHLADPATPNDPFNQILIPVFSQARFNDARSETENSLLLVSLALQAYKSDHGAYPPALSALVPAYLKVIPDDPCAASGPLHYKLSGSKYVLYSVGPDGKDDGGKPIFNPSRQPPTRPGALDQRYQVENDSTGDIVAGVNMP